MVVAHLVEWLLPTTQIHGSNPDILFTKTKIKEKRGRERTKLKKQDSGLRCIAR